MPSPSPLSRIFRSHVRSIHSKTASLDRFKPVGDRQDNPLQPEAEDLMGEYYARIAQRILGGVISLYRAGRLR